MKKAIILSIFIPIGIFAQKTYPATVFLTDGTTKIGKTGVINNTTATIRLQSSNDQNSEKIKRGDISKIVYYNEAEKDSVTYLHSDYLADFKNNGKPKMERSWMQKIYSGKNVSAYVYTTNYPGFVSATSIYTGTTVQSYYLKYKNELPKFIFYTHNGYNMFGNKGYDKTINTLVKSFFDSLCPKVSTAYENKQIVLTKTPIPLAEYYEENCNK